MIFNVGAGGSTGKLVHLHISYDPSLAGANITATNGTESHTAVADTSGLTIISGTKLGEWTVSEDSLGTSVNIETTFYGNYITSIGGDRFITVTYESAFEGKTITCTNGSDTQTRVASGGSVQFCFMNDGTYDISATVSGNNYSTLVVVNGAGQYTAELQTIPDGSTITPVDNIQIWLKCTGVNKSYTTIDEVLADNTTLNALISDSNAVDYMARSSAWASAVCANQTAMTFIGNNNYCADKLLADNTWCNAICDSTYFEKVLNVKVPTLSADSSNVFASSIRPRDEIGNYFYKYYVFDGKSNTFWGAQDGDNVKSIGYKFSKAIKIRKVTVQNYTAGNDATTIQVIAKNSISDANIDIGTTKNAKTGSNAITSIVITNTDNTNEYLCWGVRIPSTVKGYINITKLGLYGREEV